LTIRSEEDCRSENSLERSYETPVLRAALLHAEGVQHCGGTFECNLRRFLPDRLRREKDRDQPILSPRQTVARVPCDLQDEVSIPALMQQTAGRRAPYGEPTKHERVEMRSRDSGERFPVSAARTRSTRLSACDVWRRLRQEKYAREALRFGEDLPSRETRLSWRRLRHDLPKTTRIGSSDHLRSKPAA